MSKVAPSSQRRRRRPGVLMVLAGFLLVSAAMRLGSGLDAALAEAEAQAAPPATVAQDAPDSMQLLESLRIREARLAAQETAMADRVQALALAEQRVADQLAALQQAESALASTLSLADQAAENDLLRLTSVYESMRPREAAALFEEMEPDFAAGFLARMRPEAAAEVMAGMAPRAAYAISVILAGRNARVPRD